MCVTFSGVWFWVAWTGTLLKVGTGTEPDYSILLQVLIDPSFPGIGAVGFKTIHNDGIWEMSEFEGNTLVVNPVQYAGVNYLHLYSTGSQDGSLNGKLLLSELG